MGFGDVRTEIVPKGVVSTLGDGTLRITVPTTFESSVTSTHLSGAQLPIILSPVNLTGSFTLSSPLTSNTFLFVSASSPLSVYLPSANVNGLVCYIKKIDDTDNAVTLVPSGSQKIDNSSSKIITIPYTAVSLVVNEGSWWVF